MHGFGTGRVHRHPSDHPGHPACGTVRIVNVRREHIARGVEHLDPGHQNLDRRWHEQQVTVHVLTVVTILIQRIEVTPILHELGHAGRVVFFVAVPGEGGGEPVGRENHWDGRRRLSTPGTRQMMKA